MRAGAALKGYAADVARAFDRAPVECILSVIVASFVSYAIEDTTIAIEVVHLAVAAGLIAAAAWGATLAHALRTITPRTRWMITLAGAAAGAVYLGLTPDFNNQSEGWRILLLVIASVSLVFAVPAFAKRGLGTDAANLYLRRVNARFLLRAVGIALYGLTLFAGLAVALAAIDNLFDLKIQGKLYGHVNIWIMLVLVPWVIVGGLDDYVRPIDEENDLARVVRKLATFLLPPLVAIYYLILCAYVVRIAITHEMPQNLVSPMVVAAGVLSCIALIVFDPAPEDGIGLRWLRYTPIAFIPLAAVGFRALQTRTGEYGWTEFRMIRTLGIALLFILAVGAVILLMRRRRYPLRNIPAWIGLVCALAAAGPWGLLPMSRRSQQHRLASALEASNVEPSIVVRGDTTTRRIPLDTFKRISSASMYLESHFGAQAVTDVVAGYTNRQNNGGLTDALGIGPDRADTTAAMTTMWAALPENRLTAVPGGAIVRVETDAGNKVCGVRANRPMWVSHDSAFVAIGADTTVIPLTAAWGVIQTRDGRAEVPAAGAALPAFALRTGARRGYLTVLNISWDGTRDVRSVLHLSGVLMLPNADQASPVVR